MLDGGAPVQPGDVLLGRYRVEHVLGQGGMGMVVAARHLNLGELFAIKFLLPSAVAQPQAAERFLREARAAARLKSEHVARVVDVGSLETGAPYMVMEHLAGSDLSDLIRKRGPLPVEEAVTYVLQACDAFSEAHSQGIVHRDIKPANLFLTRRPNGSPCIKVLDFGISKQLGRESVDLTGTHMSFGSPLYMSPEQMMRAKSADQRTDIWSMGIVLYELLTGTTPFLGESVTEVVGRVLQEEPARPSQIRRDLPPWVDFAILGCLQKPREKRFQTIHEFVSALTHRSVAATAPLPPFLPTSAVSPASASASIPSPSRGSTAPERAGGQTDSAWGQTSGTAVQPGKRRVPIVAGVVFLVLTASAFALWLARGNPVVPEVASTGSGAVTPILTDVVASPPPMPGGAASLAPTSPGTIPVPATVRPEPSSSATPTVSSPGGTASPAAASSPSAASSTSAAPKTKALPIKPKHEPMD